MMDNHKNNKRYSYSNAIGMWTYHVYKNKRDNIGTYFIVHSLVCDAVLKLHEI